MQFGVVKANQTVCHNRGMEGFSPILLLNSRADHQRHPLTTEGYHAQSEHTKPHSHLVENGVVSVQLEYCNWGISSCVAKKINHGFVFPPCSCPSHPFPAYSAAKILKACFQHVFFFFIQNKNRISGYFYILHTASPKIAIQYQ